MPPSLAVTLKARQPVSSGFHELPRCLALGWIGIKFFHRIAAAHVLFRPAQHAAEIRC